MNDIITVKSVVAGFADVAEDFILCEEAMSRLVFHAHIHQGGIRGKIIRQRRESREDIWNPEKAIDIRTLGINETINLDVNTAAVKELYNAITKLAAILKEHGVEYGENSYAVVDPDSVVITNENKVTIINKILNAGYSDDVWQSLTELNPDLATKLSYARLQTTKQKIVDELDLRLKTGGYLETTGDDSWQKWIYQNNWLFGVNYSKPIEKTKINITGIMPDYIFPRLDGFVDILEIKLPTDEVLASDSSHPGSWKLTTGANIAIGQVLNYLSDIDRQQLEIERNIKSKYGFELCLLKPHAYILIGNSSDWDNGKKEALRKMNHALHGIEILTYQDLLDRGNQAIRMEL